MNNNYFEHIQQATIMDNLALIDVSSPSFYSVSFGNIIFLLKVVPHISLYPTMNVYDRDKKLLASTIPLIPTPNIFRLYPSISNYIGVNNRIDLFQHKFEPNTICMHLFVYKDE